MKIESNVRRPLAALSLGLLATTLLGASRVAEAGTKVLVPAGTEITLQLEQALGSETSHQGDAFELRVAEDVKIDGRTVIRAGSKAHGTVTVARTSGRLARQGRLGIELETLQVGSEPVAIRVVRAAEGAAQPRARRFLSRIAAPVTRVARTVASATNRELVSGNVTQLVNATDGKATAMANHALGMDDPLADVELGGTSRAASLVGRGVRGLERVGTGYVSAILSGPTGLLKKGTTIEMPAGTTIHAVIVTELAL